MLPSKPLPQTGTEGAHGRLMQEGCVTSGFTSQEDNVKGVKERDCRLDLKGKQGNV